MKKIFLFIILLSFFWNQVHALVIFQSSLGSNKSPVYISGFVILEEGGSYQCRFSLKDEDYAFTTAAGTVYIQIIDSEETVLYEHTLQIEKSDFGTYELILTGEEFIAYVWSFDESSIDKGFPPGKAILTFTSGGLYWEIENDWVTIPEYSEEELAELFEEEYKTSRVIIAETVAKLPFEINLEAVGEFTYRPYSWSEEETYFRIDISVRNYDTSSAYFWANFVIIDDLWNQYDSTWSGTLQSGEMQPGVIRKGYLLFPFINPDATTITIRYIQSGYPDDTIYEFILNMEEIKPKEPSQITCSASDSSIVIHNSITISGDITPAISGVPVTLTFTKPDGSSMIAEEVTYFIGLYSYELQPDSIGTWRVVASWIGDSQYSGSVSDIITFSVTDKISSSISCGTSINSVYQGNQVEISGKITPLKEYEDVILHISDPDGIITDILLETNNVGRYSYTFSPTVIGLWLVNVSWMGDSEFFGASNVNEFTVMELPPTGSLTVTVYDLNNQPIIGALVSSISLPFIQESFEGYTNSDGGYSNSNLFIGSYKIQITKNGYDDSSQNFVIEEDETTQLEIHLTKKVGSMKIYVKDSSAKPCEGASITSLSQPSGQSTLSDECNNDGFVLFNELKPGDYEFLASLSGYESSQTTVTVIADELSEKTIILEKEASTPTGEEPSTNRGIPGFPTSSIIIGVLTAGLFKWITNKQR